MFLFENIFTFTALSIIFEFTIFIPLNCYYFAHLISKLYLVIPIGTLLFYPIAMWSLSAFSMFPILNHVRINPNEIGKKEEFHKKMYQYCKNSENKDVYENKIIIINYLCVKTYFQKLTKGIDSEYYQFAKWLSEFDSAKLQYIEMSSFTAKAKEISDNQFFHLLSKINLLKCSPNEATTILKIKIYQISVRLLIVTVSVFLDIFYLKIFEDNSSIASRYGFTIQALLITVFMLFVLWIIWMIYEIFISKWNHFCFHMITSKHEKFGLLI
eukprot:96905_1